MQPSVAVIGSGVSGLTAAYLLSRTHEVTLFEQDRRFGGHAHTHTVPAAVGELRIDSGFIVHNQRTYPHLLKLFAELEVETQPTEMSMSISCQGCGLQYAGGRGASGILAQPARLIDPRFVSMLMQVPRFHRAARKLLADPSRNPSWGEFLKAGGYSDYFIRHFAIPLVSCVWSAGDEDSLAYPARHLFAFLNHHGMLSIGGSPKWRTVVGGSATYVDRIIERLPHTRNGSAVTALRRHEDHIELTTIDGEHHRFDRVVVATHANDALALLADASAEEREMLAAIGYSTNHTWLHRDTSVLPENVQARASWNYRIDACDSARETVLVSYWMNRLQSLPGEEQFLVSLNAAGQVDESAVIARMEYQHPIFTHAAVTAAEKLAAAGGPRLAFAGAHLGWGFHEDGARSGVQAARKFGVEW